MGLRQDIWITSIIVCGMLLNLILYSTEEDAGLRLFFIIVWSLLLMGFTSDLTILIHKLNQKEVE